MYNSPLVSIIIPTYNRAHIIHETLDSIKAQTFSDWECIVVDDSSTDNTTEILQSYLKTDNRFKYYMRSSAHLPGGNGARNYGFNLSKGQFVQWFDSDDLMKPEKLQLEVEAIKSHDVDFVISKTRYFNRKNNSFFNYNFEASDVNFESYAIDYIRWHTPDLLLKRSIAKQIEFNEQMTAGQEYNFNCKLLLITTKFYYLNQFLTLRRYSSGSIQGKRDQSNLRHLTKMFETYWYNYLDLKDKANSQKFNRFSILQCMRCYLESKNKIQLPKGFYKESAMCYPKRWIYFYCAQASNKLFNRHHLFYLKIKNGEAFNTYALKLKQQNSNKSLGNSIK